MGRQEGEGTRGEVGEDGEREREVQEEKGKEREHTNTPTLPHLSFTPTQGTLPEYIYFASSVKFRATFYLSFTITR